MVKLSLGAADFNPQVELCPTEDRDCFVFLLCKHTKHTAGSYLSFIARNARISCKAVDFFDSQKG